MQDEYLAYCLDSAAAAAGSHRDAERQEEIQEKLRNNAAGNRHNGPPVIDERGIRGKIPFIGKRE